MSNNRATFEAKNLSDNDHALAERIKKQHGSKEGLIYMLECVRKFESQKESKLSGNDTLNYIDEMVKRQMDVNRETDKTHIVGSGKNTTTVKYEQRSITDKWVMDNSIEERDSGIEGARAVSRKAAQEYIELNQSALNEHHEWLCNQADMDFTTDNVRNFNRRTGKAAAAVARLKG